MAIFRSSKSVRPVTCVDIVDAYGRVLEEAPLGVGGGMCASRLPYPTGIIKEALAYEAARSGDEDRRRSLRAGFLELGAFVENWQFSTLTRSAVASPKDRAELQYFFEKNGNQLADQVRVSEEILAKRALLEEEWQLRLRLQVVAAADRIAA